MFTLIAAMLVSTTSFAQSSHSSSSSDGDISKGWNSVYVQYNNLGTSYSLSSIKYGDEYQKDFDKSGLSDKLNGFSIGYNRAINVAPSIPLYVEVGGAVQFSFYSDKMHITNKNKTYTEDGKYTGNIISVKAPISLLYHIAIPNSNFAFEPFAGIDFKYNISGSAKGVISSCEEYKEGSVATNGEIKEYNRKEYRQKTTKVGLFSKDDCKGHQANRFQMGWHVGVNAVYKRMFIGVSYGQDFSKFQDDLDLKFKTLSATLGFRF